jgi:predicted O-methyltransferase YrrM
MTSISHILKRIKKFDAYFSEKYVAPEYTRAWELNKKHGINLNPLSPFSAFILKYIIKKTKPHTILEIGTSGGYSALSMANVLQKINPTAQLYTVEKSLPKIDIAKVHISQSGLKNISLLENDAIEVVNNWKSICPHQINILFLDADRKRYLDFLQQAEQHLSEHALVIADNVRSHPDDVRAFTEYMKHSGKYSTYIVPFSKGLLIAKKK